MLRINMAILRFGRLCLVFPARICNETILDKDIVAVYHRADRETIFYSKDVSNEVASI